MVSQLRGERLDLVRVRAGVRARFTKVRVTKVRVTKVRVRVTKVRVTKGYALTSFVCSVAENSKVCSRPPQRPRRGSLPCSVRMASILPG